MGKYCRQPPTRAERVRALLESLPDDVGQLPAGPIDAEEIEAREARKGASPAKVGGSAAPVRRSPSVRRYGTEALTSQFLDPGKVSQ